MTNFEKIKQMSIPEMAEYIFDLGNGREYCHGHCIHDHDEACPNDGGTDCIKGVIKWLESERDE